MDNIIILNDDASDASSVTLDNDYDNDLDRQYLLRESSHTASPFPSLPPKDVVDLTDDDDALQDTIQDGDYLTDEYFELLLQGWHDSKRETGSPSLLHIPESKRLEECCDDRGILYKPGQSVELLDDTFLRICSIWETSGQISFQGRRLSKMQSPYLPSWKRELIWSVNETHDIPLRDVRRFVPIHFSNFCQFDQDPQRQVRPKALFCRLKETSKRTTTAVEYLTYAEADIGFRAEASVLRNSWRGETASFGSQKRYQAPVVVLDEMEDEDPVQDQKQQRKYTFGDGFCGAGGVSCGAESAGLHLKWAFDKSLYAAETYRLNFPTSDCESSDIFSFLTSDEEFLRVDVSHGSPPCQTFSSAHTIPCANDDANSACIFSCRNLISKAKPRIHTMEETSGLLQRHQWYFFTVVNDFIEIGYSVRWALVNCVEYGVPQVRKRLVIIASGPGETLPSLPRPTHGPPGSNLEAFATIKQVISNIPRGWPGHDVEGARARARASDKRMPAFDGNQQARTITCSGGESNFHPSGQRHFTNREFACLQTFPLSFQFGRHEVRKQVGNAVPPLLARSIYLEIVRSLQETDERELREKS